MIYCFIRKKIFIESGIVKGVKLEDGTKLETGSVILTTGPFLNGLIRIGQEKMAAGRVGDFASTRLAKKIRESGLNTGRLKTGTPARLSSKTINWQAVEKKVSATKVEPKKADEEEDTSDIPF